MNPWDTLLPRTANFIIGAVEVGAIRMLYALPRHGPPALEAIAFPGDGVPWPWWQSLPGAAGKHPHSGGLLGSLHRRLQSKGGIYSRAALFVVEPRLAAEGQPFALYDELLPFSLTASGEPTSRYDGSEQKAATRLEALLDAAYSAGSDASPLHRATTTAALPEDGVREGTSSRTPLLVFGFSKGGIVLNQLLAECSYDEGEGAHPLIRRIAQIHYLDAGLQSRGAHLTDPAIIGALGRCCRARVAICFHGTPRQWKDSNRAWLVEEKDRSAELLSRAGLTARQRLYFEEKSNAAQADPRAGLALHFGVVDEFDLSLAGDVGSTPSV